MWKIMFHIAPFLLSLIIFGWSSPASSSGPTNVETHRKSVHQKLYLDLFKNAPPLYPGAGAFTRKLNNGECEAGSIYQSFNPQCQKAVGRMVNLLQQKSSTAGLLKLAVKLRDNPRTHPKAWYTALTMVTFSRADLRELFKPQPIDMMPDSFINRVALIQNTSLLNNDSCIIIDDKVGQDNLIENRLWYFREDIQINSQHWYWHTQYPHYLNSNVNDVYHADRRGELFYFFHHTIVARYNAERLSNNLPMVSSFKLEHGYIMEPYYAHLNDINSGKQIPDRKPGTPIPEVVLIRQPPPVNITFLTLNWTIVDSYRITQSIDNESLITAAGGRVPLQNFAGIDYLVDVMESSIFSVNLPYYGGVHNSGHNLVAFSHDPLNPDTVAQVMLDNTQSMRDIEFYKWHSYIDDIVNHHKRTLPPYHLEKGDFPLIWRSIRVESLSVYSSINFNTLTNKLQTFWSIKNLILARGFGFDRDPTRPPVKICAKHLNHEEFTYNIVISTIPNWFPLSARAEGTVRIFMAPRFGPNGQRFTMEEQRLLFFIMDTFSVTLTPGVNMVTRKSTESALTIPWGRTLGDLEANSTLAYLKPYCGCGWPAHLLLPKGTPAGMPFDLFVIVTNGDEEKLTGGGMTNFTDNTCKPAPILCGVPYAKYPDSKPMGYPFDRGLFKVNGYSPMVSFAERSVANLDEYAQLIPNAATTQILIQHNDKILRNNPRTNTRKGERESGDDGDESIS